MFRVCGIEILAGEGPHFLSLAIVGVVVAGAKSKGSKHDAGNNFVSESISTSGRVHGRNVLSFGPHTLTNTVVAG